ncbi:MAG: serine/threonine protein kinase [Deltaproteobacteria bacterium]|nr:serine/threonine protein kinase [Deltaproteobacteria bacterium]
MCGRDAQLDDDPSILFEYVRSVTPAAPPAAVLGTMRRPDSWLPEVPGVRLTTRQSVEGNNTNIRLAGIIDGTFPGRQVAATDSPSATIDMQRVAHFDASGFERWRTAMDSLTQNVATSLVNCSAVALRRFADDPALLSGATVASILFPGRCGTCRRATWYSIAVGSFDGWLASSPSCAECGVPIDIAEREEDYREFIAAVSKQRPGRAVAASSPAPAKAAPPKKPAVAQKAAVAKATVEEAKKRFANKYEFVCKLGEGGMAEVHLVRQHGAMGFRRLAVVKQVRADLSTDDRMIRLFLDEAKLAARMDHPNVIRVLDLERVEGSFFMVLEFVHGRSLTEIMSEVVGHGATVPPTVVATIIADLCKGLARAHIPDTSGRMLVHRDVTPGNVLVSFDGVVKLVDFGLAGYVRSRNWDKDTILGNPFWMAPEIFLGKEATPQTDLWGAGLLLISMLTGANPFRRATVDQTAYAIVNDKIDRPGWTSKIPRSLFPIIEKSLEKDPAHRYSDAGKMEADLRAALTKLKGETDLAAWLKKLFPHVIRFENEFVRRCGASSLVDALLASDSDKASRFFRLLQQVKSPSKS